MSRDSRLFSREMSGEEEDNDQSRPLMALDTENDPLPSHKFMRGYVHILIKYKLLFLALWLIMPIAGIPLSIK